MYLLDTDVLSALSPARRMQNKGLAAWIEAHDTTLFLSVVTIAEIEDGVAKLTRTGASRKAEALSAWLEAILHIYGARILAVDVAIARRAGRFSDEARRQGQAPGFADLLIAATAQHHDFTLLTRNVKHFSGFGIRVRDPLLAVPGD